MPKRKDNLWDKNHKKQNGSTADSIYRNVVHEFVGRKNTHRKTQPAKNAGKSGSTDSSVHRVSSDSKEHRVSDSSEKSTATTATTRHIRTASLQSNEWYTYRLHSPMTGIDMEMWWRKTNFDNRLIVVLLALLFSIMLIYLGVGVVLLISHFVQPVHNPYVCNTADCKQAAVWLSASLNTSVDPCENFYEFVCGAHVESEKELSDVWFAELMLEPSFKNEFGANGYLAKVLKTYKNSPEHDQEIIYYKACLNHRNRKKFGLTAFQDVVERIFGTNDFNTFESSSRASKMEEIGTEMFRVAGHAVYINMAFYVYPYIQIIEPMWWFFEGGLDSTHLKAVEQILSRVMPMLQVPENSSLIPEMVAGFRVLSDVVHTLREHFHGTRIDDEAAFEAEVKRALKGLCPPLGININLHSILNNFTGEDSKTFLTYHNYVSLRGFKGLQICFNEDSANSQHDTTLIKHPKTAFVSVWMFGLFYEFAQYMETTLLTDWKIDDSPPAVYFLKILTDLHLEYQCWTSTWRSLGYLPSIRFLEFAVADHDEFLENNEDMIKELFKDTRQKWALLPDTVHGKIRFLGKLLWARSLDTDVVMALNADLIDYALDILNFTDDHLRNSMVAIGFTIEKARQTWLGSTDTEASIRWWGHGNPRDIRNELFSLQSSMIIGAEFQPVKGAAPDGKWKTFLGRKSHNYILFPLTLFFEPHTTETLALQHAGITAKIVRTFMTLLLEQFDTENYGKYEVGTIQDILDWDEVKHPQSSYNCSYIKRSFPNTSDKAYRLTPTTSSMFSLADAHVDFASVVAIKITLNRFRRLRKKLRNIKSHWLLSMKEKALKKQRMLPGSLSKYTEEQLFFMGFVRQMCRQSWKTTDDQTKYRYELEVSVLNALMSMEEFSTAWNCKNTSFMNLGEDRCLKWKL